MPTRLTRKIVRIDEALCNGCGECIPSCAEGAIRIVAGKARLVADNLCDGLGACLGRCPSGAIVIEERPADDFDPAEVERRRRAAGAAPDHPARAPAAGGATRAPSGFRPLGMVAAGGSPAGADPEGGGCPGSRPRSLAASAGPGERQDPSAVRGRGAPSRLGHWPVQLALVPVVGPIWQEADVLVAADCVPFATPGFHEDLLAGRSLAIACPKLDDMEPHVRKLAEIFSRNRVRSVTVARMEVPCCTGIVRAVEAALRAAGRGDLPIEEVVVSVDGRLDRGASREAPRG